MVAFVSLEACSIVTSNECKYLLQICRKSSWVVLLGDIL